MFIFMNKYFIGFILFLSLLTHFSCKKDKVEYPSNIIAVGAKYQGGIIAYIYQPSDPGYDPKQVHGIIAAPSDQSAGICWNPNPVFIATNAVGTGIGTGKSNTEKIIQVQGAGNYAAKLCADLVLNGYSDWYLPSKSEFFQMISEKEAIGKFVFPDGIYWTSSEYTVNKDWVTRFYVDTKIISDGEYAKSELYRVRAIRYF